MTSVMSSHMGGAGVADPETTTPADLGPATFRRVIRDQRKTIGVAIVLGVAAYWVLGQLGEWTLAGCIAGLVALGLNIHLVPESWLLPLISSGEQPPLTQLAMSTLAP